MKKFVVVLVISVILVAGGLAAGIGYLYWNFKTTRVAAEPGAEVVYEVRSGASFNQVATDLQSAGVVRNAQFLSWYARLNGQRAKMKTGEYMFKTSMLPDEVLAVLTSGRSIQRPFTVPEGYNLFEIANLVEKAGLGTAADFFKLVTDQELIQSLVGEPLDSLEGYLFPETYQLSKKDDAKKLITLMVKASLQAYEEVKAKAPIGFEAQGLSRHEVMTFASIVEKETGAAIERPLIASVFHNRLAKRMRLQTDPTVIYGKAVMNGRLEISITKADLSNPTPYNTYVISGLPPGPIANPGKAAIDAVLRPAQSSYLFFVSQNDGTHVFTETYQDHLKAVRKFQLDPKAREGKSWRDLKSDQK